MFDLRAKTSTETDILMYGSISEWGRVRCEDFIKALSDAKAKGYEKVNLKINSPGGSVIEGIAIMSQMVSEEIIIVGVVEGVAASMASAMLQGCHRRKMVKGTRMMIHQAASGTWGSANYLRDHADLMDSFNKTLAEIYSRKTKRESKWILENWMAEGRDTWFTAEDALKEGLIDEIIEGKVKPMEKAQASLIEMAAHYQQIIDTNSNQMNRDELIKQFGLKADATDADILAAIANLKANQKEAEKKDDPKKEKTDPAGTEKNDALEVIATLAKDRGMTDAQIESVKILAKSDMKAAMALIPEKKAEAESGTININDLLKGLKGGNSGGVAEDRKSWSFDDWQKKDQAGLLAMAKDKPEEYAKLFKAQHGSEISVEEVRALATK